MHNVGFHFDFEPLNQKPGFNSRVLVDEFVELCKAVYVATFTQVDIAEFTLVKGAGGFTTTVLVAYNITVATHSLVGLAVDKSMSRESGEYRAVFRV